jgi:hypothetical protein
MRITIQLSADEAASTSNADWHRYRCLAEAVWALDEAWRVEGVDLRDHNGQLIRTIVGDVVVR